MAIAFVVLVGLATSVGADDKPWATGVPESEQKVALALYQEGNAEFAESRYPQALAKYREAIKHWDHPGIRFNMVVCLVNLDQPLEANEHLEKALAFGAVALGDETFAQGQTYKKLLGGQLSRIKVICSEPGAQVRIDGTELMSCPGEVTKILVPGPHQLVSRKAGLATEDAPLVLMPGKELVHVVKLEPIKVRTRTVRRWSARTPWIVFGSGLGAAAIGGVATYLASQERDTYDQLVAAQCPDGCSPSMPPGMQKVDASTESIRTRGRIFNVTGISLLAAGGAVTIAGLVAVYMNLPRNVIENAPLVTPTVTSTGAGASATWSF